MFKPQDTTRERVDVSARVIGLDPAAANAEHPLINGRRTVRQIDALARQLQSKLEASLQRAGAANLYRIAIAPWAVAGRFDISMIRQADDAVIMTGSADHHTAAGALYSFGAEVFHAGIAAEIESILAERTPGNAPAAAGAGA
jgi:hypothetical protein